MQKLVPAPSADPDAVLYRMVTVSALKIPPKLSVEWIMIWTCSWFAAGPGTSRMSAEVGMTSCALLVVLKPKAQASMSAETLALRSSVVNCFIVMGMRFGEIRGKIYGWRQKINFFFPRADTGVGWVNVESAQGLLARSSMQLRACRFGMTHFYGNSGKHPFWLRCPNPW